MSTAGKTQAACQTCAAGAVEVRLSPTGSAAVEDQDSAWHGESASALCKGWTFLRLGCGIHKGLLRIAQMLAGLLVRGW